MGDVTLAPEVRDGLGPGCMRPPVSEPVSAANAPGRLILHIGMPKTGTTALQRFFYTNREHFMRAGVEYPTLSRTLGSERVCTNGDFLSGYCGALARGMDPLIRVNDIDENIHVLSAALGTNRRVLLSEELLYLSADNWGEDPRSCPSRFWGVVANQLDLVGAKDILVVVYLRRQDAFIASRWRQCVRSHLASTSFEEFRQDEQNVVLLDYANMLGTIQEALGQRARILVRRYDRSSFFGGDVFHDFCHAVQIPWDDGYELPEADINTSLSYDVAEALRKFVVEPGQARSPSWRRAMVPLALELTAQHPDPPGTTPFSQEETRRFMEAYAEGNRLIEERYLGGEPLFSDDYTPKWVWEPDVEYIRHCECEFKQAIVRWERDERLKRLKRSKPFRLLNKGASRVLPLGAKHAAKSVLYTLMGVREADGRK